MEAVFSIPVGMDPDVIANNDWLFKQVFGADVELDPSDDQRTFVLKVYPGTLASFEYDLELVREMAEGVRLPIYAGRDRTGDIMYDMVENPHLLIAGETGSGKSVALRSIITTLVNLAGDRMELYCADLKMSEFHLFKGVARQVVTDAVELNRILLHIDRELKARGKQLEECEVAHIDELPAFDRPDYIVLAIDEVALLKKEKGIMDIIEKISAIGRALGVFLILSMQRPDATILDGKLKNNLTVRMGFRHADDTNSRITLDSGEAAQIKNKEKGKFALKLDGIKFVQGPFLSIPDARSLLEPFKREDSEPPPGTPDSLLLVPEEEFKEWELIG
jgi:S-DNA-T family DNA segregation ATPase FtsK/SpoIIIE